MTTCTCVPAGEQRECEKHGLSPEDEQVAQWVHRTSGVPLEQAREEMRQIAAFIREATKRAKA